ncbi:MAG: rod shape-determining protein MreC [Longimicrobiales bacterium]
MAYFGDPRQGKRRDDVLAGIVLLLALGLLLLPTEAQAPIRQTLRGSILRPFVVAQSGLTRQRSQRVDVRRLRAQRDSLAVVLAAYAPLAEENRRLRGLLELEQRGGSAFLPTAVLRVGVSSGESTFLLGVGSAAGVRPGSPVLAEGGLLGVVREVDERMAHAVDWTHVDFRASAMTADGGVYGIVQPRRGQFREEDELILTGAPFHSDLKPGMRVVTSGRGGVYPRGIPLGTVVGIEEADTGWRKSYVLRPAVRPEAARDVLVGIATESAADLSGLWFTAPLADRLSEADTGTSAPR